MCAGAFSLHTVVAVPARDRKRLERLLRYIARPPAAAERLQLRYLFRKLWHDSTLGVVLTPPELIEKLAASWSGSCSSAQADAGRTQGVPLTTRPQHEEDGVHLGTAGSWLTRHRDNAPKVIRLKEPHAACLANRIGVTIWPSRRPPSFRGLLGLAPSPVYARCQRGD
jgi:hypothetical protein